ncbi:MAG: hypothetical protein ACI9KE_003438 [Polyangiales bacterium]|jgi:hypothetical protein
MRLLLCAIPVFVGCTLISDADSFVGERDGGTDAQRGDSGETDAEELDAATPDDVGPFTDGSCAAQVDETREDNWDRARCCFSDDHCEGLMVGSRVDDGRCLPNDCGNAVTPLASVCLPSLVAIRAEFGDASCYLDADCMRPEVCRLGEFTEFSSGTCPNAPPLPGECMVEE